MTRLADQIAARGRHQVMTAQHNAWLFFGLKLATDPTFRAEVERARAGKQAPITCDTTVIIQARVAGALTHDDTITLFKRTQGGG
jgi:hypothetical protein